MAAPLPSAADREHGAKRLDDGRAALARGDLAAAAAAFADAARMHPSLETHAALGALYFRMAVRSAWVHLQAAADLDPDNADRWIALANAHLLRVDPGEAQKAIDRARTVEPELDLGRDAGGFYERRPRTPQQGGDR